MENVGGTLMEPQWKLEGTFEGNPSGMFEEPCRNPKGVFVRPWVERRGTLEEPTKEEP